MRDFRAPSALLGLVLLAAAPARGETLINNLRDSFINCVEMAFILDPDRNLAAVAERSFDSCRIEENAYHTTLASALIIPPGYIGATPADQAMLMARSLVDRLKINLKRRMLAPATAPSKR